MILKSKSGGTQMFWEGDICKPSGEPEQNIQVPLHKILIVYLITKMYS